MTVSRKVTNKLDLVSQFIGADIYEYARLKYEPEYSNILIDKLSPELKDILDSCKHHKDHRSSLEYGKDLLLGWIVEDYVFDLLRLNNPGISILKSGEDSHRKFLRGSSIKSTSDFIVATDNKKFFIELISDFKNFWKTNRACHLRDKKLSYLKRASLKIDTYILALDIVEKTFQFIKVNKSMKSKYIPSHFPFGGKPAHEIYIDPDRFHDIKYLSIEMLVNL